MMTETIWWTLGAFLGLVLLILGLIVLSTIYHLPRCWGRWLFVRFVDSRSIHYAPYEVYRCSRCGALHEEYE